MNTIIVQIAIVPCSMLSSRQMLKVAFQHRVAPAPRTSILTLFVLFLFAIL